MTWQDILNILILFPILGAGLWIGHKANPDATWVKGSRWLGLIGLFALIFVLGLKIGSSPKVMGNLKSIGFKGLTFALLTTLGSALGGYAVMRRLPGKGRK
ncbi:MAG: hypothetical protein A4E26_00096 [Methanobacterium sp. PtaU1.Bin097]|nr:MAG: hypothetical protein A4E26_00096 [Methanobacterium sp. PtaU1.Bin097]